MFNKLKQIKDLRSKAKEIQSTLSEEIIETDTKGIKKADRYRSPSVRDIVDEYCWGRTDLVQQRSLATPTTSPGPTRGHYATYNATAPIEVSSTGNTRHRLNLRGNRILNHAIHIAAVTQLRHDTNGRIYFDKNIAEGKTSKEAIRALKRRISDRVYSHLVADAKRAGTT